MKKIMQIVGSIVVVISLITGVWMIDDRYVDAAEMKQSQRMIYIKIDTQEYRVLTEQYYKYKRMVEMNPNDNQLRKQYNEIAIERKEVKIRIDKRMENK